jgi:hypothetical protein
MANVFGRSGVADDGGLGLGDLLRQQISTETDQERKKRLQQQQEQRLGGTVPAAGPLGLSAGLAGMLAGMMRR